MIDKNRFEITGNLVAAPELRYTKKGTPVAHARIIHNRSYKDRETGEWKKGKAMGIDITVWGAYGEAFVNHANKGTAVFLVGEMEPNDFEAKDGTKYFGLRVKVNEWNIIGHPRAKDEAAQGGENQAEPAQPKARNRRGAAANNG